MSLTLDQFIQQLTDSGIMTAEEIGTFTDRLPEAQKPADAESLAKKLVAEKKLTPYQANAVWKGKTKGLILGNYVILDKIGQGGMGMVFKARHKLMKRVVALKVLPPAVNKDENAVKRFLREVEAAAKLTHPNIVAAHDADQSNGAYYLIMEYVEGKDLSVIIKKQGPATVEQAVDCVLQAARGLEYAHQEGVIHRDIKPANLLLAISNQQSAISNSKSEIRNQQSSIVKILDMGLARIDEGDNVDAATQAGLTGTGTIMGTIDYMSPEQAEDTRSAGPQADIYSLGATLYFLLLGKPIVSGNTIGKKLKVLMTGVGLPTSISTERANVPESLDAVFRKMTAFAMADRYQSMTEVIADLEAVKSGAALSTSSTGIQPVVGGRSEDSAMNSFLVGLDEPSSTNQTMMAPVDLGGKTSDTFSESSNLLTQRAINPTQILSEALREPKKHKRVVGGVATAAVLLVGLVIWAFSGGDNADSDPDKSTTQNGKTKQEKSIRVKWIDLMPQIDAVEHAVAGEWRKLGNDLTTNAAQAARITVPYHPSGDYEFRTKFTRNSGSDSIALIFVVDGQQATYEIDAWGQYLAGIQLIDGQDMTDNSTRVENQRLVNGQTYTAMVRVRDGTVSIYLDEKKLTQIDTDHHEFALMEFWQLPNTGALGVGAHNAATTFHSIEVREISSAARSSTSRTMTDYAFEFDGFDDYIEIPSLALDSKQPFTLESWVQPNDVPPVSAKREWIIASWESKAGIHWNRSNDSQTGSIGGASSNRDNRLTHATGRAHPVGKLCHAALCWNGSRLQFFLDGKKLGGSTLDELHSRDTKLVIGARKNQAVNSSASDFFLGQVDELRVSSVCRYTENFTPQKRFLPDEQTTALYHFDEAQGKTLVDASGNGHDGIIHGGRWTKVGTILQPTNYALEFDGVDDYVTVPSLKWDGTSDITIEANVSSQLFQKSKAILELKGGKQRFNLISYDQRWVANSISAKKLMNVQFFEAKLNQTFHLAAVFDNGTPRLFVDGHEHSLRRTYDGGDVSDAFNGLVIGGCLEGANRLTGMFKGSIDEVRISKTARYTEDFTPRQYFTPDQNTLALYHFDEGIGNILNDSSGNGHQGKIIGAKWIELASGGRQPTDGSNPSANTTVSPNYALEFDGKSSHVEIPSLKYDGSHPITLEGWATADSLRNAVVVGNNSARGGISIMSYGRNPDVAWRLITRDEEDWKDRTGSQQEFKIGTRYHLAVVFDGRQATLYIDGWKANPVEITGGRIVTNPNTEFRIGASRQSPTSEPSFFFAGTIDEVHISKVARYTEDFTPQQRFTPDTDTLALYHFDSGSGDVLKDSSGNGHHGKIVGAKWIKLASGGRQPTDGSNPVANTTGSPPPANPDREAAEWVLGIGSTIKTDMGDFKAVDELPQRPFRIAQITLSMNSKVTDEGLTHLKGLTNLTQITFGGTTVGDAGLEHLKGLTSLVRLQLHGTPVTGEGLTHLKGLTNLVALSLYATQVDDAGLTHLKRLTRLSWLGLAKTNVTDAGLDDLKELTKLTHLSLQNTKVTAAGVADLQKALPNCNIQWDGNSDPDRKAVQWVLSIGGEITLTDETGQAKSIKTAADLPEKKFVVTGIGLNRNLKVTDDGLKNLVGLQSLTRLNLSTSGKISDAGLVHLKGLTSLKVLGLYATKVTDTGLKNLAGLKHLDTLILGNTKVTDDGVEKLQKVLPNCQISR